MDRRQATIEALERAASLLDSHADLGSESEVLEDLGDEDRDRVRDELRRIAEGLMARRARYKS